MRKTKEFFAVLFSILICVFLVVFIVQATTTISTNIVTEGTVTVGSAADGVQVELEVGGSASVSQDLLASGSVQFGAGEGTATVAYSRFGSGSTGHGLTNAYDVLITGLFEVDDLAYFDKDVTFAGSASVSQDLIASGSVQFGGVGIATASYSRFGSGSTGHSLADADDVLVTGLLEVNELAYFDAGASVSGGDLSVEGGNNFSVDGTASVADGLIIGDTAVTITSGTASVSGSCTQGSLYLRAGQAINTTLVICDAANTWTVASISEP